MTALILTPLELPFVTEKGAKSSLICAIVSRLIGFLTEANPLSARPIGSFAATPSIVKLLNLGLTPRAEISVSLKLPCTAILESLLRTSPKLLSIEAIASKSSLVIVEPGPISRMPLLVPTTVTSSTVSDPISVTRKVAVSSKTR